MEESELVFLLDEEEEEEVMTVSYSREKHQLPASLCSQITPGGLVVEVGAHETMPLRNKPLLSLVKSLSTEISRREPEVSQSRSDSKLNLHLWRQLTQPRGGVTELSSAPSSPSSPCPSSPSEPKAGFFKAELEDTRRKFSEAIQEPLSMLSKIMREEEPDDSDSVKNATPPCDTPSCKLQNPPPGACGERRCYDVCTHGDVMQAVQDKAHHVPDYPAGHAPVPCKRLFGVAALAYGFFVLPLPTYVSGLSLGVACGFVIGLLVVLLLAHRCPVRALRKTSPVSHKGKLELTSRKPRDSKDLEGWMNEASTYDPETHHPLLLHSVYASLEGSVLQLAYPGSNVPRRAAFGEIPPEATFHRSHCFQVAGSKVFLSPPALARKRIWNKKYPICIRLVSQKEGGARTPTEEELISPVTLYLFGRTGREKEEWFQYFLSASKVKGQESHEQSALHGSSSPGHAQCSSDPCRGSSEDLPSLLRRDIPGSVREKILLDYSSYMARFVTSESRPHESHPPSPTHSSADSPALKSKLTSEPVTSDHTAWVNALLGRIFWDFLREKYWCDQVAHKIQKKLSRIRLPYFMNELTLTELDMGSGLPQVMNISQPSVDNKGLWLDLDLVYTGALQMTLETKMNLCKLGKEGGTEADCTLEMQSVSSKPKLCILGESDEESSSAGSSDEEELPPSELQGTLGDKTTPPGADGHGGGRTGRKILRFVDKIAKSKYFQKATENEYIRKKIVEVSNTPLLLTVEVRELSGGLAINIPPPPTDRIWYSFRVPPRLDLRVRPMLGEREVTFTHVTEWIEKKLQREFQKVFVMPNMDDLYLPLMHSNLDNPPASHTATGCNLHHSSEEVEKQKETSVIHKDYS